MSFNLSTPSAVQMEASGCCLIQSLIRSKESYKKIKKSNLISLPSQELRCMFSHTCREFRYIYVTETQANLIFCKTHLDDAVRIVSRVKWVLIVGLPSIEVRRVFSMSFIGCKLRQKLATHHFCFCTKLAG